MLNQIWEYDRIHEIEPVIFPIRIGMTAERSVVSVKDNIPLQRKPGTVKEAVTHILIAVLIFVCAVMLLSQKPLENYVIPQYLGTQGHTEPVWTLKKDGVILDSSVELPAFLPLETGSAYSISAELTYDGRNDRVPFGFFYIHHMYCRAYLDGEQVFSYMPEDLEKLDHSKSPGNIYASFPVPPDCRGKEFIIEFFPPLSIHMEYELPYPVFGDFPSEAHHTFASDLPHNIVALLSAFLGIASIIFSSFALTGSKYREGIYIGIFSLVFCIYNITECNFNFYVISNPYFTYTLNYITFTLIPVFLIAFLRERMDRKQKPVGSAMLIIASVLFFTELILHFSGTMDMREFLPVLHISYFAELMVIFILLITMRQKRWKKQLILQMLPILAGMVLDAAVYYEHWQISSSDAAFTTVGVVIFLIIELFHVWQYSIEIYSESIRSQEYQQMAYVDALTGIGNRRAFEAERENILSGEISYDSLCIASADLNYLKETNDRQGHAAGDFLIRNAAEVLSELAENSGKAFRVGGDEFMVFLYNMEDPDFLQRVDTLNRQIAAVNSNSNVKLSLAIGWERIVNTELDSAIAAADKKMYANKFKMKAREKNLSSPQP